ncbi:hypothetical protein [Bacillus thuringiensis]|nr:hypothetical protein [Bacillus thuringiensis]
MNKRKIRNVFEIDLCDNTGVGNEFVPSLITSYTGKGFPSFEHTAGTR